MEDIQKNEERLLKVFTNVSDWLKFAEAKNAMILAFNAASIFGASKFIDSTKDSYLNNYLFFVIILLIFSCAVSLISFAPRVKIIRTGLYAPGNIPNSLFFEYLKTLTALQIIESINGCQNSISPTQFEIDVAEQIKQNSIIASRKYSYFTISVWLTISAYITFPLAIVFCIYTYINKH
jgi:hypothetical protein